MRDKNGIFIMTGLLTLMVGFIFLAGSVLTLINGYHTPSDAGMGCIGLIFILQGIAYMTIADDEEG